MLRLLHTSDWHLGHSLHDVPREREHERFLAWLLDVLAGERVDVLLLTGDVFDVATPPASAEARLFGFLAEARRRRPSLATVIVGGNHDSAARLDAPAPALAALGVTVFGGLPRDEAGAPDPAAVALPLRDAAGNVAAQLAAVPFLRTADLPAAGGDDPLVAGVRAVYDAAVGAARARRRPGQALLATGHCYVAGGALSELSERRILGGNQHALPVDLFAEDLAYVALGHLHRPQAVGRETIRYAGSPIPLSLSEDAYPHQVVVVELDGERASAIRSLRVPRTVDVLRVPADGPRPLEEVLPLLEALPARTPGDDEAPYLEVRVALDRFVPELRAKVEAAVAGRHARLVKITTALTGSGEALADALPERALDELSVEEVVTRLWRRDHESDPPDELLRALDELVVAVEQGEEAPAPRREAVA